ncbi:MAG: cobalamin B12-binding domain-containing protein [Rhodobacteraceae bacterium]|jgi:methanogenic corrinoid protein MtbC1|nr:cobalamin B12-binding domain-containing protein [Paracoccaceae bacterium]
MLRLGTLDMTAGEAVSAGGPASAFIKQALGNLVLERQIDGTGGVAVEQLCSALVADAPRLAVAYVDRLLECGVSVDALYETFIPRAAARLGEMWLEDLLPFTGVTLGMARLTEVYRGLSPIFMKDRAPVRRARRALFAAAPGEHHTLGVVMAADHFQRRGWSVQVELQAGRTELARIVRDNPFDLIGLSAGSRRMVPVVEETIATIRPIARHDTRFVLGGALVSLEPGIAARIGVGSAESAAAASMQECERD